MVLELYPQNALVLATRAATLPIAFLVGAPLSIDAGIGVPNVAAMLDLVRDEIQSRIPSEIADFEAAIYGKSGGEEYQTAISWLRGRLLQEGVNNIVRRAVLRARKGGASTTFSGDGDYTDWDFPTGVRQLAKLVVHEAERFPGPILTTNFDPLISLAIEESGGRAARRVVDSDGGIARASEIEPGSTQVVHLHGYWRDSDTLHTRAQLTTGRPKLEASLRRVLQQRALMVFAYGGWDDVFSAAFADLLNDESAQINVLWCFHENDQTIVEARYKRLLERVAPAISRGRFNAYGGIDCHLICAAISEASRGATPPPPVPLVGWDLITPAYLSSLQPLSREEAIRYFDGAVPTWRHAVSDLVPRRQLVSDLTGRLNSVRASKSDGGFQLIRAAGGEGKSTLLLQIGADLARSGDWIVLSRPSPEIGLVADQVAKLDPALQWLIVADDAENLIHQLRDCAVTLHSAGRSNVHFLFAARDSDWRAKGGDKQNFESFMRVEDPALLRGISLGDAKEVVTAWSKCGPAALKALSNLPDLDRQADELFKATKEAGKEKREGSLFGGLLAVRFDESGLRAHVRGFLSRLQEMRIVGSSSSLFDALVYVAAAHAAGIPGLDENVLADLLSVPRHWVNTRVIRPLGEEAAAVQSAEHVFTRHRKVADAVLVECDVAFEVDLSEVWAAIMRQTVKTHRSIKLPQWWFTNMVNSAPHIYLSLPKSFSNERRTEIAVAAAEADIESEPMRLSPIITLGKTYRLSGHFDQAIAVFRDNLNDLSSKVDFRNAVRSYWYEWGVCEGSARDEGHVCEGQLAAGVWLQGLSLADQWAGVPVDLDDTKIACAGLGFMFGELIKREPGSEYLLARRAAAYIAGLTNPDPKTAKHLEKHNRELDQFRAPQPKDIDEGIIWLSAGIVGVRQRLTDLFLKGLTISDPSFNALREFLAALTHKPLRL